MLAQPRTISKGALQEIEAFYVRYAGEALGIMPENAAALEQGDSLEPGLMDLMITMRAELRKEKLWGLSDKIRDGLIKVGVVLEDKKEGTTWKRSPRA